MITPLPCLCARAVMLATSRRRCGDRDLSTLRLSRLPPLQSADILIYRAGLVPVGEDQRPTSTSRVRSPGVSTTFTGGNRVTRRWRRRPSRSSAKKNAKRKPELRQAFLEQGDKQALVTAWALLERQKNMTLGNKERLVPLPRAAGAAYPIRARGAADPRPKMPGLDGRKMSASPTTTRFRWVLRIRWR